MHIIKDAGVTPDFTQTDALKDKLCISDDLKDFITKLFRRGGARLTAAEALGHPWIIKKSSVSTTMRAAGCRRDYEYLASMARRDRVDAEAQAVGTQLNQLMVDEAVF